MRAVGTPAVVAEPRLSPTRSARWPLVGALTALALTAAALAVRSHLPGPTDPRVGVALLGVSWLAFGAGAWLVLRLPRRAAVVLVLGGGLALQLAAGFGPPHSSDDLYRYVWDGRVQTAGINPYRYAPAAPELVGLRDSALWPARSSWCVAPGTVDNETGAALAPGCTLINRPNVHTIYPPVAEALFFVVDGLSPPGPVYQPIQVTASLLALATAGLLVFGLRRLGLDPRRAVLWAWCPTVAVEAANNAHVDVAAALLSGLALVVLALARSRRMVAWGGVLLGLAIATKLTPGLLVPSVLRRRPVTLLLAVGGAVGAVYLPHVLTVGSAVLGYIPGYLKEEGYVSGERFALLSWAVRPEWTSPVAAAILALVALLVVVRTDPDRPWVAGVWLAGAVLLVTTPSYPWYALTLILLVALGGRAEWLVVAAAGYVAQYTHELHLRPVYAERIGYGVALAAVAAVAVGRAWDRRHQATATGPIPADG